MSSDRCPLSGLSPSQRSMRARLAAHAMHARHDSREVTANARKAFVERFESQVDPERALPAAERQRRAEHAMRAHMTPAGVALRTGAPHPRGGLAVTAEGDAWFHGSRVRLDFNAEGPPRSTPRVLTGRSDRFLRVR